MAESKDKPKVGIIGSGLVGKSWSMLFIAAGYPTCLYDIHEDQLKKSVEYIWETLLTQEREGSLKGSLLASDQFSLITTTSDLSNCVKDAFYIQECTFENLETKKEVMLSLDPLLDGNTVVGSSTSCIPASEFTTDICHRANILVVHPVNPLHHLPLVELIPSPHTSEEAVKITRDLMVEIGQSPITLSREIPGFALNRIQYAILNECWNLVQSKILTVEDVDKVFTEGLGRRYAFTGPIEAVRMNAKGLQDYFNHYKKGIQRVSSTYEPTPQYTDEEVAQVERELSQKVPLESLEDRRAWRDRKLAELDRLKGK